MTKSNDQIPYQVSMELNSILVRPYYEKDIPLLYEAARESINEVGRWLPWCHPDYMIEESETWVRTRRINWDNSDEYSFCIQDAEDGSFLGGCGINNINRLHRFANLGYWIRSSRTGKGYASTAARIVAAFGFHELGLQRMEIVIPAGNHASQRVAEKAGAHREGLLRNRLMIRTHPVDAIMYSLIPSDMEHHIHEVSLGGLHEP